MKGRTASSTRPCLRDRQSLADLEPGPGTAGGVRAPGNPRGRLRRRWFAALFVLLWLSPLAIAGTAALDVDRTKSFVAVRLFKGGIGAFFAGHEHGILATEWSAALCYDPDNWAGSSVTLAIPVKSLRIDTEEARRKVGLDPTNGPKPADVREIQDKMLSRENLDAAEHPEIRFHTTSIQRKGNDGLALAGPLTIRGRTHIASIPVSFARINDHSLRFSGKLAVKQTDYGIEPASVAGVVKVKNEVEVRLEIYATVSPRSCAAAGTSAAP